LTGPMRKKTCVNGKKQKNKLTMPGGDWGGGVINGKGHGGWSQKKKKNWSRTRTNGLPAPVQNGGKGRRKNGTGLAQVEGLQCRNWGGNMKTKKLQMKAGTEEVVQVKKRQVPKRPHTFGL